jgi:Putative prokaryotic signal transducing protein
MTGTPDPGDELVGVGFAAGRLGAQMIKGLLESEGIRCLVRSSRSGRTVMVHTNHAERARDLLAEAETRGRTEADSLPDGDD